MKSKSKVKRVYKAVKNFLVNELKVDNEYIDKLVEDRVNKRLDHLLRSDMSEDILRKIVQENVRKMLNSDMEYKLRGAIRQEIFKNIEVSFGGKIAFNGERLKASPLMKSPDITFEIDDGEES